MTLTQLFDQLDCCPPWLCRAMAVETGTNRYCHTKYGVVPVPLQMLVERSGMTRKQFQAISPLETWRNVRLSRIVGFCNACRVNPLDADAIAKFMHQHGDHLFELSPHRMSRQKQQQRDERLAKKLAER